MESFDLKSSIVNRQSSIVNLQSEIFNLKSEWWAHQDSNLEQAGYEPAALTVELWARLRSRLCAFA